MLKFRGIRGLQKMNLRCGYGADTVRIRCGALAGWGLLPGIVKRNCFRSGPESGQKLEG